MNSERQSASQTTFTISKTILMDSLYPILLATGKINGKDEITEISLNGEFMADQIPITIKLKEDGEAPTKLLN